MHAKWESIAHIIRSSEVSFAFTVTLPFRAHFQIEIPFFLLLCIEQGCQNAFILFGYVLPAMGDLYLHKVMHIQNDNRFFFLIAACQLATLAPLCLLFPCLLRLPLLALSLQLYLRQRQITSLFSLSLRLLVFAQQEDCSSSSSPATR